MTPTVARMIASSERGYKKPIKWFAIPQLFRYERQQKGRLREHFQLNCDIFGESDFSADAEIVALLIDVLRNLGLTAEDFVIRLSSRQAWQQFFESKQGSPDKAYEFYQVVDKIERERPEVSAEKLSALGIAFEDVKAFIDRSEPTAQLQAVLDNLAARGLSEFVKVDYNVIRGLAYYTGVVFEAFDRQGEFRAIAGGGRYDNLVKLVSNGKVDLPALGFGMGDVVLLELLKSRGKLPVIPAAVDVVILIESENLRPASLGVVQHLREAGFAVEYSFTPAKSDKQFKRAVELGAKWTVRLEASGEGVIQAKIKNLGDRSEKTVAVDAVTGELKG
jgi:histidyl-tRNA synthetase